MFAFLNDNCSFVHSSIKFFNGYTFRNPCLSIFRNEKSSEIFFHLTASKSFFNSKNAMSSIKLDFLGL